MLFFCFNPMLRLINLVDYSHADAATRARELDYVFGNAEHAMAAGELSADRSLLYGRTNIW